MATWLLGLLFLGVLLLVTLGFTIHSWLGARSSEEELWCVLRRRIGGTVLGNRTSPWTHLDVRASDLQVSAPGGDTMGHLQTGAMKVESTAPLPDLVVVPERLQMILFGLNGPAPIPTGTAEFDGHWRVFPVMPAGQGLAAPPGVYVSWARPDVLRALYLLDIPSLRISRGQLTMALPHVNMLGVELAVRTVRTIRALVQGQRPEPLALPALGVVHGTYMNGTGLLISVGLAAIFVPAGLTVIHLVGLKAVPGVTRLACPHGGSLEGVRERHRRNDTWYCVSVGPEGRTLARTDEPLLLSLLWGFSLFGSFLLLTLALSRRSAALSNREMLRRLGPD